MSVLAIGISVYDTTVTLKEPFVCDSKHRVVKRYECAGGQASNAACVCGRWGLPTYMVSRVGEDTSGKAILDTFHKMQVDTSYMRVLPNYTTSASVIINHQDSGQRTILNYQDPVEDVAFDLPEDIDFLMLDAHEEKIGMKALQKYKDIPSMLDAERVNELTLQYAKHVDYIVGSENFAKGYCNIEIVEENYQAIIDQIRSLNHKHVIITLGDKGLIYEVDGKVKHMKAHPVKVVDSTGAGDIFHGTLAYALHEHFAYEDALRFASISGALAITKQGSSASIPNKEEVEQELKKQ